MRSLIHRLRTRLGSGDGGVTDESLLAEFLAHRADAAFAAIVSRHGPMVLGVCRRVLRNDTDADDAFQAVFLVLLRKAESVRPRSQLGNWLYGVAVNVARRGRDAVTRRRTHALTVDVPERTSAVSASDLRELLDQELSRLPDAYRAAVVACDLEGYTRTEAAGRLGWSEGTVASRLTRGRALLADRLARRGVAFPAIGLAAALGPYAGAAVPVLTLSTLLQHPSPAAEGLAAEVVRTMLTSKLRTAAALLLAAVGIVGAGTATVWACGPILRPTPPITANKPFPLESNDTREARGADATAAWGRPTASVPADAGADKPAGAGAGTAKPARFVLTNPARDITVVSDRHETFDEFFRRQPVMIATVKPELMKRLLAGKAGDEFVFVDAASFNVDGPRNASYGASVKLAPLPADGTQFSEMIFLVAGNASLIFVGDPGDKNLWRATGYTHRSSVGFFASTERVKPDEFAPADLLQVIEKK